MLKYLNIMVGGSVLSAILALREDAYAPAIHAKVHELSKSKSASLGAVYFTLDWLEDKGLISSRLSEPRPERGNRPKRCYRLEALGERALHESPATAKRIWDTIRDVWGQEWSQEWKKQWRKESG